MHVEARPIETDTGYLTTLRSGWYFRAADVLDELAPKTHSRNIYHRSHVEEGDKALLLENQGETANSMCWTALVNGEVIIVWEDDIRGNNQ